MTVDRERLVEWALRAVSTPSFTGSEEAMARLMEETFRGMRLQVPTMRLAVSTSRSRSTENVGGLPVTVPRS